MGSDLHICPWMQCVVWFQSTLPHGERPMTIDNAECQLYVSIHAPAWGATSTCCQYRRLLYMFQSTLPHGERQSHDHSVPVCIRCFNPRSRMGSDMQMHIGYACSIRVSIHAPAWGATCTMSDLISELHVSIHAPAWGATKSVIDA